MCKYFLMELDVYCIYLDIYNGEKTLTTTWGSFFGTSKFQKCVSDYFFIIISVQNQCINVRKYTSMFWLRYEIGPNPPS